MGAISSNMIIAYMNPLSDLQACESIERWQAPAWQKAALIAIALFAAAFGCLIFSAPIFRGIVRAVIGQPLVGTERYWRQDDEIEIEFIDDPAGDEAVDDGVVNAGRRENVQPANSINVESCFEVISAIFLNNDQFISKNRYVKLSVEIEGKEYIVRFLSERKLRIEYNNLQLIYKIKETDNGLFSVVNDNKISCKSIPMYIKNALDKARQLQEATLKKEDAINSKGSVFRRYYCPVTDTRTNNLPLGYFTNNFSFVNNNIPLNLNGELVSCIDTCFMQTKFLKRDAIDLQYNYAAEGENEQKYTVQIAPVFSKMYFIDQNSYIFDVCFYIYQHELGNVTFYYCPEMITGAMIEGIFAVADHLQQLDPTKDNRAI